MRRSLFVLFIVALLAGCTVVPVQPTRVVYTAPAAVYAPTVACPYGTELVYWNSELGYKPVCVSQTQTVYAYDHTPGPSFGWGVVTGVVAAAILHSLSGGRHGRGGYGGYYHRRR